MLVPQTGHTLGIEAVAFTHDGKYAVTGGNDKTVHVWEMMTGREIFQLAATSIIETVACSSDGKRILAGCRDKKIRVWDRTSGTLLGQLDSGSVFALSPDGKQLLIALQRGLSFVNAETLLEEKRGTRITDGFTRSLTRPMGRTSRR